jgi:hypothetical protein
MNGSKMSWKGWSIEMQITILSMAWILPAVWFAYTIRSWWVARSQWKEFSLDTKAFYLLVTPLFTIVLDLLLLTDKVFYSFWHAAKSRVDPASKARITLANVLLIPGPRASARMRKLPSKAWVARRHTERELDHCASRRSIGLGMVSPLGSGAEVAWARLLTNRSGLRDFC